TTSNQGTAAQVTSFDRQAGTSWLSSTWYSQSWALVVRAAIKPQCKTNTEKEAMATFTVKFVCKSAFK
uniref:Uncharacterized protein n=1 Tax=Buteo japonicus TaxID=224669 RepID=A0A8C0B4S4_9AVES